MRRSIALLSVLLITYVPEISLLLIDTEAR